MFKETENSFTYHVIVLHVKHYITMAGDILSHRYINHLKLGIISQSFIFVVYMIAEQHNTHASYNTSPRCSSSWRRSQTHSTVTEGCKVSVNLCGRSFNQSLNYSIIKVETDAAVRKTNRSLAVFPRETTTNQRLGTK